MSVDFGSPTAARAQQQTCFSQEVANYAASSDGYCADVRATPGGRMLSAQTCSHGAELVGAAGSPGRSKLKRSRQRVDAGEPRNTYSSIFYYSSVNGGALISKGESSPASAPSRHHLLMSKSSASRLIASDAKEIPSAPPSPSLKEDCPEEQRNPDAFTAENSNGCTSPNLAAIETGELETDELDQQRQKKARVESIISCIQASSPCVAGGGWSEASCSPPLSDTSASQVVSNHALDMTKSRRKRYQPQQLEISKEEVHADIYHSAESVAECVSDMTDPDELDDDAEGDEEEEEDDSDEKTQQKITLNDDQKQLKQMHKDLFHLQKKYIETLHNQHKRTVKCGKSSMAKSPKRECNQGGGHSPPTPQSASIPHDAHLSGRDVAPLIDILKADLITSIGKIVDKSLQKYCDSLKAVVQENLSPCHVGPASRQSSISLNVGPAVLSSRINCSGMLLGDAGAQLRNFYCPPVGYSTAAALVNQSTPPFGMGSPMNAYFSRAGGACSLGQEQGSSIYPQMASQSCFAFHPALGLNGVGSFKAPENGGSMMPRKRRNKVTDTRVNRMSQMRPVDEHLNQHGVGYLPSMVPTPYVCVGGDEVDVEPASPEACNEIEDDDDSAKQDGQANHNSILTPMHLRKAKLMFFYTRYPSSVLLKTYFPDIKFNKNNTAQLVKWFSNFREFYYIQMEKYARQAISQGLRSAEDIHVSTESELYKVLNLHYNRNNHVIAPTSFRRVVEATLHEFFDAIQCGRDAEPSWKKSIYKIIARMDDSIPEYFKTPNFLETLE